MVQVLTYYSPMGHKIRRGRYEAGLQFLKLYQSIKYFTRIGPP